MGINWDIREFQSIDSTNREMQRLLEAGPQAEGLLLRADYQTVGQGYRENVWESEAGKNLLFSLLLKSAELPSGKNFLVSMITALSLFEIVDNHCNDVRIKWPNDLLVHERKVAGILIENSIIGRRIEYAVVGVGLNVNQAAFQTYRPPATSLHLEKGCHFDIQSILDQFTGRMEHWYGKLQRGMDQAIRRAYLARLFCFGKEARYRSQGGEFSAAIQDIALSGAMKMRLSDGSIRSFGFKEVEYLF